MNIKTRKDQSFQQNTVANNVDKKSFPEYLISFGIIYLALKKLNTLSHQNILLNSIKH